MQDNFVFGVLILVSSTSSLQNILHSITGVVSKNNFSYYTLQNRGYISIVLKSEEGDADLYISQPHISHHPTFDPDTYCLQSTTCGIDILHIPKWFKRPIYLGIYGHPSNEIASYTLDIIQNSDPGEEFNLNLFESEEENETQSINNDKNNDVRN
ncbi:UPF0669 protein v1g209471-like [Myzus persicae]|uniref:UPF0669 protein v1g209471-like n=1 Tax=Myzus persicae TaxID=13164 RepID=UPI000B932C45|nr:UPF0669 protein v1g209471-like [Myzus persicae]